MTARFGPQCSRSTLSTVNYCHPSEATQLALHSANPFSSLFQLSVCQLDTGPHQKALESGLRKTVEGGRVGGERGGKKSAVTVVGGNAKQGSMPWVGKGA